MAALQGVINGRFRVSGTLGEGASSRVLAVEELRTGEPRALKVLHADADEAALRAEFARLSRLRHPNLVQVHDLVRLETVEGPAAEQGWQGRLGLVLERVAGEPALEHARSLAPRERERWLLDLLERLCSGLAQLHGHGIVHHDVKPDNVLLAEDGRPVLIDLGLAGARGEAGEGEARGTPAYMAPEALLGGGDHRVDLYALGATAFHLAYGRLPFSGSGPSLLLQVFNQPPQLPEGVLNRQTGELILRLLAKEPLRRPPSARWLQGELARRRGDLRAVAAASSRPELLPPAFCGHRQELSRLQRALGARSRAEGGPFVVIQGPVGVGKSRLVEEALRRHRLEAALGRLPAVSVLRGPSARLAAQLLGGGTQQTRGEGGGELPEAASDGQGAGGGGSDPLAIGEALDRAALELADALWERAEGRPMVVHLPSLEQDPLATRLVGLLGRDPRQVRPLLLLVEALDAAALPEGLLQRGERLEVAPLSLIETGELVDSMLAADQPGGDLARRVHELGGGLPALSVELTAQWHAADGALALDRVASWPELVKRGRGALPPDLRRLGDAVALWNGDLKVPLLVELLQWDEARVWSGLEALSMRGLGLSVEGAEVTLRPPSRRRVWQRAAARAPENRPLARRGVTLARRQLPPDRLRLAELALVAELAEAGELCLGAAAEAARGRNPRRLQRLLGDALVAAEHGGDHDLARRLRRTLARLLLATADYARALELLPPDAGGAERLLRGRALLLSGDYDGAEEALGAAESWPDGEPARRAEAIALRGRLKLKRGRPGEAAELVEPELSAVADPLPGSPELAARAALEEVAGLAHLYLGELDQAQEHFGAGIALLERDPARRGQLARFHDLRGMALFTAGDLPGAEADYAQALDLAHGVGDRHQAATYEANLGAALLERGSYAAALERISAAVHQLERLARTADLAWARCNLANLALQLGDLEQADRSLAQAEAIARDSDNRQAAAYVLMLRADVLRRRERPADAVQAYREAGTGFAAVGARREQELCRVSAAEAWIEARALQRARSTLGQVEALPGVRGPLALAQGRLALLAGEEVPADGAPLSALARHAEDLADRGARRELWRVLVVLGALYRRAGDGPRAEQTRQRAREQWQILVEGAPEYYREAMARDPDAEALLDGDEAEASSAPAAAARGEEGLTARRLRRLITINKRLNSELRLPYLLEFIMDVAIELTEAERGFLLLVEQDERLEVRVARNIDQRSLSGRELSLSRSIAERAARSGEPVVTVDAAADDRFEAARSVSHLKLRSVLAAPLSVKGRTVGTIYLDHRLRPGAFGALEVRLVQDLADQAAIAVENARLLEENRRRQEEIQRLNQQLQAQVADQQQELEGVREELRSSKQALKLQYEYKNIVGRTAKMMELFRLLDRITDTDLPVVVEGESGTGKELVARAVHFNGSRSSGPFVGENCGAIPETLLESVLFGHVKGAFTGADRDRKGLFEVANGGTLFLDEVGEMSPAMQTKLLRVLQNGEIRRVGGSRSRRTDVRIIAASNRNLATLVRDGRFREDLYYRLNVVHIVIPPLRERREDIPLLVDHLLAKHSPDRPRQVSSGAMAALVGHAWPGNVRELENEIMRAAALAGDEIQVADLSPQLAGSVPLPLSDETELDLKLRVEHLEREMIGKALATTSGNQTRAAELLGLSRYGLLKKIKRYAITIPGREKG